jgi:diguanylate cyclase (GGDEF)-like protein/PAS domain S-box-containing protein
VSPCAPLFRAWICRQDGTKSRLHDGNQTSFFQVDRALCGRVHLPARATTGDTNVTDIRFADFLHDIVARFDPQYRHTYVNSAVELFTGRPAMDFIGKTNRELGMPPDLVDDWDRALGAVFASGQAAQIQFNFDCPHGQRTFRTQIAPEHDASGAVVSVVTFARDVTGEIATRGAAVTRAPNPALEMAARHYQAIIDSSEDAIIGKTLGGVVTSWNRGAQTIFGYTEQEMLGQSLLTLFPPERVDEERFILERILLGEAVQHFETVRIHKDGHRVHVSVSISPIRDTNGTVIGASKISRNITPLKVEQERLKLALDAASNGLWDWNLRTGHVYRSDHYDVLTGYPPDDDTHGFEFFARSVHPHDLTEVRRNLDEYLQGISSELEFEYRLVSRQGVTDRWMQVKGRIVERDSQHQPLRLVGTLSDITKSKQIDAGIREREKRLSRVLEGSDQGYWDWNLQSSAFQVSARWETMLGFAPGEMDVSLNNWPACVHPDDYPAAMRSIERHLSGMAPAHEVEIRCRTKSNDWKWILTKGSIVEWDPQGKPLMMAGTHTDISERKRAELLQREALTVFANSYEGIMVVSPDLHITRVNPAFSRITGYEDHEVLGQSPKLLSSGKQSKVFYLEMWTSLQKNRYWAGEIWNRKKSGELYAQLLSISAVLDDAGAVQHYIGIFSDLSQIKAHQAELDRVANYDLLTDTPNRRLLVDRLAQAIERTSRGNLSLAVCYLDLDGFKAINDRFGHTVGDRLLVAVTENIRHILRTHDTIARIGGDEFVLLLADIGSPEECSQILERILQVVGSPLPYAGNTVVVHASIGVSLYPQDRGDADSLLRHADQAMYQAKDAGKNRFHLFDPESDRKAQLHRALLNQMHSAIDNNELLLYYQPKVDLTTGEIIGAEALLRWQHPSSGFMSPTEFLPHVEGSHLVQGLGIWVLGAALSQAAQWLAQGQAVAVSVNISAHHLLHPEFLNDLRRALATHPEVNPAWLELEVLESAAIDDMDQAIHVLKQCHALGVQLALDDFGTGYSSLTYLRKLPVDTLKIDQSFVRGMLKDDEDLDIVEGVISLALAFNRKVIAEGVETMAHGKTLVALGCRLAQGYGIARPMPAGQFLDWATGWAQEKPWLSM